VWLVVLILHRICERILEFAYFWLHASFRYRYNSLSRGQEIPEETVADAHEASSSNESTVTTSEEQIWLEYFEDPAQWWDNRLTKRNVKAPDFKHKVTKRALWINGWYTPEWVRVRFSS
jgi:hypothetical protein